MDFAEVTNTHNTLQIKIGDLWLVNLLLLFELVLISDSNEMLSIGS